MESHRPSWRRCGDAEGVGIRVVLPNHIVVGIYLDGAGVACISKQGVPVIETTGERDGSQSPTCRKGFDDLVGAGDLDGPIIVFVGDQNMPVFEQLAGVGLLSWSAALVLGPGYCQTIFLARFTSITRLLPWSVIRTCPGSIPPRSKIEKTELCRSETLAFSDQDLLAHHEDTSWSPLFLDSSCPPTPHFQIQRLGPVNVTPTRQL